MKNTLLMVLLAFGWIVGDAQKDSEAYALSEAGDSVRFTYFDYEIGGKIRQCAGVSVERGDGKVEGVTDTLGVVDEIVSIYWNARKTLTYNQSLSFLYKDDRGSLFFDSYERTLDEPNWYHALQLKKGYWYKSTPINAKVFMSLMLNPSEYRFLSAEWINAKTFVLYYSNGMRPRSSTEVDLKKTFAQINGELVDLSACGEELLIRRGRGTTINIE